MTLFKGTTEKCFLYLLMKVSGRNRFAVQNAIAEFVGCESDSVHRWFRASKPTGENLVRLRFFLDFLGCKVTELESLPKIVRDFGRIVAFKVVTLSDAANFVGYKTGDTESLLRVLHGKSSPSKEKQEKFVAFVEAYDKQLVEKERLTKKIDLEVKIIRQDFSRENVHPIQQPVEGSLDGHKVIIESLVGSIKALIPLVREVSSDSYTAEEREKLRELAGPGVIFSFSNLMYRLCSEKGRSMINSENSKKEKES